MTTVPIILLITMVIPTYFVSEGMWYQGTEGEKCRITKKPEALGALPGQAES